LSALDDWIALYRAVYAAEPSEETRRRLGEVAGLAGNDPSDLPAYLGAIARNLAARRALDPTPVPSEQRAFGWLLRELVDAFPGAQLVENGRRDIFIPPGLGLAAAVTRGEDELYEVIPWSEKSTSAPVLPKVMGTFNPTPEQVREWAYRPDLRLASEDEHLALAHAVYLPVLLAYAADPECPKRRQLLAIADGLVASARSGPFDRELIDRARAQASSAGSEELSRWAQDLADLRDYIDGQGPASLDAAVRLGEIALRGRHRAAVTIAHADRGAWWELTALHPSGAPIDRLYVAKDSGALVWSRDPLSPAELAPHTRPKRRDEPLGARVLGR
jgi:hypothetical protein